MQEKTSVRLKMLKTILWVYIIFCFIIAGINYGYANRAPQNIAMIIKWVWLIYENWVKTLFILICSFLTIKIIGASKRTGMRKKNLIGFIIAALSVHIVIPLFAYNYELYFFTMPLPWTTTPLQLLDKHSSMYRSISTAWGINGILSAFIVFICVSVLVLIGTLLFGRRFQCSTICLFNGFAAEVFDPAIPLIGKRKKIKPKTLRLLYILRWIFLAVALFFVSCWVLYLLGVTLPASIAVITKIESYKYLAGELLMMMFFWIAFVGRGYCFFCPLGTVLSLVARIAGQKIKTDNTRCVGCNKCNDACPMAIDIKGKAVNGISVQDIRCVGCGHCVDECPTNNLRYSTRFIEAAAQIRLKQKEAEKEDPVPDTANDT
ncbi:MAG: 4Fe-4S dicluster domain-containing protein [Clostridiaceae bacterium]|nr:4Fe-4S dicluster domain-containing protein [Clostridiaceae bacterium]